MAKSKKMKKVKQPKRSSLRRYLYVLPCATFLSGGEDTYPMTESQVDEFVSFYPEKLRKMCAGCNCFFKTATERKPIRIPVPVRKATVPEGEIVWGK